MSDLATTVQDMYKAFNENKAQTVSAQLDENLEWELETSAGNASSGKGVSKIGKFFEAIAKDFNNPQLSMTYVVDCADKVAALGHYTATVKATGRAVKTPVAHFFESKGGKVTRFVGVISAEALAESRSEARTATSEKQVKGNWVSEFYGSWPPLVGFYTVSLALMLLGPRSTDFGRLRLRPLYSPRGTCVGLGANPWTGQQRRFWNLPGGRAPTCPTSLRSMAAGWRIFCCVWVARSKARYSQSSGMQEYRCGYWSFPLLCPPWPCCLSPSKLDAARARLSISKIRQKPS